MLRALTCMSLLTRDLRGCAPTHSYTTFPWSKDRGKGRERVNRRRRRSRRSGRGWGRGGRGGRGSSSMRRTIPRARRARRDGVNMPTSALALLTLARPTATPAHGCSLPRRILSMRRPLLRISSSKPCTPFIGRLRGAKSSRARRSPSALSALSTPQAHASPGCRRESSLPSSSASEVAGEVHGEARQHAARRREADAVRADRGSVSEDSPHLAPRAATAQHGRALSGGRHPDRFHAEKPPK